MSLGKTPQHNQMRVVNLRETYLADAYVVRK